MSAPRNALGAVLLTAAWVFFTTEMVLVRILSEDLSIPQIGVFRLGTQALLLLPLALIWPAWLLATRRFPLHAARTLCSSGGMVLFYLAFALLPLALATTLTFMTAAFVMILASLILGERIGPRRIAAVSIGFLGVLVAMRPGAGAIEPGMLIALAGAFVAALLMILTRQLSSTEGRLTIMAYSSGLGLVLMAVPALLTWAPLELRHLPMLGLVGLAGTSGQFLMVWAFQIAEASALAPVDYLRLIFAVLAGYAVFAEVPDLWTWAGAAIIVSSVAYATHRERLAHRHTRSPR